MLILSLDGYTGYNCETDWDECWNEPCLNGGTCSDGIAHFNCSCQEGFTGDTCQVNIDECLSDPCQNGGSCQVLNMENYTVKA